MALDRAGLSELLRHRAGTPASTAEGIMVFSRYKLGTEGARRLVNGGVPVDIAASRPFRLLAVRMAQPVNQPGPWHDDLREVRSQAAKALAAGPTMVVGDFDATRDHPAFRSVSVGGCATRRSRRTRPGRRPGRRAPVPGTCGC